MQAALRSHSGVRGCSTPWWSWSLSGFERDPALKVLLACIGHAKPAELAADIEAFLVDNKLLLEVPGVRATAQQITRAQISLIACEWLT